MMLEQFEREPILPMKHVRTAGYFGFEYSFGGAEAYDASFESACSGVRLEQPDIAIIDAKMIIVMTDLIILYIVLPFYVLPILSSSVLILSHISTSSWSFVHEVSSMINIAKTKPSPMM